MTDAVDSIEYESLLSIWKQYSGEQRPYIELRAFERACKFLESTGWFRSEIKP